MITLDEHAPITTPEALLRDAAGIVSRLAAHRIPIQSVDARLCFGERRGFECLINIDVRHSLPALAVLACSKARWEDAVSRVHGTHQMWRAEVPHSAVVIQWVAAVPVEAA